MLWDLTSGDDGTDLILPVRNPSVNMSFEASRVPNRAHGNTAWDVSPSPRTVIPNTKEVEMEIRPDPLVAVSAVLLENGIPFHAKMIGLPHFLVPLRQALKEGFLLALASEN